MANSVGHAALPYPVKGARYTLLVPYLDSTGTPTDPTTPDTEVSIDNGGFADCTEEVTTLTGSNGTGFITLTGDETNCSFLALAAKVASGPKTTLATLYPRVLPILESGTAQAGGATSITLAVGASSRDLAGCIIRTTGGTGGGGGSGKLNNQARIITAYNGTTKVATVEPAWETNPANGTTYDVLITELAVNALKSNLVSIDGAATSGNNAVLNLKQLNIVNDAGSALVASSTGSNGHGINASGNGSGHGVLGTGGLTGSGLRVVGGGTSGAGLAAVGSNGNAEGVLITGNGSGAGLSATGGSSGPGIDAVGGSGSGAGLRARAAAGNSIGLDAVGAGTQPGLSAVGGATGAGAVFSAASGNGITATGGTNGHGMALAGAGSGEGLSATGGSSGHGIEAIGGSGSGSGFRAAGTLNADGITAAKHGTGKDIRGDITGSVSSVTGNVDGSVASVVGLTVGNLDAAVSTRAPESGGNVAAIKAKTDGLPNSVRDAILADSTPFNGANIDAAISSRLTTPQGIKKNTAYSGFQFTMYDSTGAPKTGLTVTLTRSIDGGAFGAAANSVSEIASGAYTVNLAASDVNGDTILFRATATGAADQFWTIKTVTT